MSRRDHLIKAQIALGQLVEHLNRALDTPGECDDMLRPLVKIVAATEDLIIDAQDAEPQTEPDGDQQYNEMREMEEA